jgi:hypothetical protein
MELKHYVKRLFHLSKIDFQRLKKNELIAKATHLDPQIYPK